MSHKKLGVRGRGEDGAVYKSRSTTVAESRRWCMARRLNAEGDSREILECFGFKIVGEKDEYFYEVEVPEGWSRTTRGFWTRIVDPSGVEQFSLFLAHEHNKRKIDTFIKFPP